jgi:hypothetical protein
MHCPKKEELMRHAAVHAIGSVIAAHLFDTLMTGQGDNADAQQACYFAAVERLTVTSRRQERE